jgi:signal transduction histidine kinase
LLKETVELPDAGVIWLSRDDSVRKIYEENLAALHSHAVRLNSVDSVEGVAKATLEIMEQVLGEGFVSFQVIEEGCLVNVVARGLEPPMEPLPLDGRGVTVRAAREARTMYVPDVRDDPDYIDASAESRSEVAVPVRNDGEVLAVLNMESPTVGAFTDQDIRLLEILALHVGSSLTRLWQEAELRRVSEENVSNMLNGFERVTRMLRHDLRSPLQSINNAAQMMEFDPSTSTEMLTIIRDNVKYISEVLDDLRTMTTIRRLMKEPLEVDALIRRLLDRRMLPDNIDVELRLQEGVKVRVDGTKLTRVVDNLINNAVEAMPRGGRLTLESRVEDDEYVIAVGDDGEGISEDDLSLIFRPFFSTKETGMGLGLTYCKEVVEAHGGSIEVASEKGVGTVATVRLPLGEP